MAGRSDRGGIKRPKNARGAMRRVLSYMMEYRVFLFILLLLSLVSNLLNLAGPSLAGKAISAVGAGQGKVDMELVLHYTRLMLLVYVSGGALTFFVHMAMMRVGRKVARNMRRDVFKKLMLLPVGYFDRNATGDIISHVSYDIDVISTCISTDLATIMTCIVTVIGSFVMMCTISIPLLLCMLFTLPAAFFYTRHMSRRSRPLYSKRSAAYGAMNGFVEEMFSGQKTILSYAREEDVTERFRAINTEAADAYRAADHLAVSMGPTIGLINNSGLSAISLGGAVMFLNGMVNLGQISSFVLYCRKFSGPINEISNVINEIFSALAASERVFRLLDEPEEAKDIYEAFTLKDVQGDVKAEHVAFGYVPGKTILKDLSLHAEPGQTIAIVGPTGAGKTTIINLLMRFYDVSSGVISVEGNDIRRCTMDSLRRSYSMVLQDTWLFNGTIFENIAYGKEGATMEEVIAAAKAAHIHNYIMQLPQGYHTVISEDGTSISKGQKQLLTIARAMLYDTNMLILDEATSNVDTNTERQVQTAMRSLMAGKTCFVIAHRLSTIQNADCILVLEHGDVVELGTHEELMKKKGSYYRMYASQFE